MREARVVINGHELSTAESMTLRVAIEHYASDLADHGLGDDKHGKAMTSGYLARIEEIRAKMYCSVWHVGR